MMPNRSLCSVLISALAACGGFIIVGCGGSSEEPVEKPAEAVTQAAKEAVGKECVTACGAADPSLRCAVALTDVESCGGGWCMVDTKGASSSSFVYCTFDCNEASCPPGFRCDTIDVIGLTGTEQACVADPPLCGDGIKQRGEACERGESSDKGTCKEDCSGWACSGENCSSGDPQCGDGTIQPPEVCDGDTAEGYCLECKELKKPFIALSGLQIEMISDSYDQWTHTSSQGSLTATLPTAGDGDSCGRFEVVEITSALVRVEFTHCSAATNSRATWTIAFPYAGGSWTAASVDEALHPTARMEKLDTSAGALDFTNTSVMRTFDGNALALGNNITGQYTIELIIWGTGEGRKAKISFTYTLLPPPPAT